MQLSRGCQQFVKFFPESVLEHFHAVEWSATGVLVTVIRIDQTALLHERVLYFAGARCELRTNYAALANMLDRFASQECNGVANTFSMQIQVNEEAVEPEGAPHFRGLHHIVIASFGQSNVFVFDLLRKNLSAYVSAAVACEVQFWKEKLIPITLGVLGATMGLLPVHCACLSLDGEGLLVAGVSGAGKSTLSVAMSQVGFTFVSDDWTYISDQCGRIIAHGTSAPVKLLPDAVKHFRTLEDLSLRTSMNGELAYEVDAAQAFGVHVQRDCEPRWLIFLERMQQPGSELVTLSSRETRAYLDASVERLPTQLLKAARRRDQLIASMSLLPCWTFRYGGSPQFAAEQLREFVASRRQKAYS